MKSKDLMVLGFVIVLIIAGFASGQSLRVKVNAYLKYQGTVATDFGNSVGVSGLTILNCYSNNDCNDGNRLTIDICNNPGTYESKCEYILDTTPPEAIIKYNQTKKDFNVIGIDDREGKVSVTCKNSLFGIFSLKKVRSCMLADESGNTLKIDIRYSNLRDSQTIRITNLNYNGNNTLTRDNLFAAADGQKLLSQELNVRGKFNIAADYNKPTNKTGIIIFENGNYTRYTKNGLVLVQLKTDKGDLGYGRWISLLLTSDKTFK